MLNWTFIMSEQNNKPYTGWDYYEGNDLDAWKVMKVMHWHE